MSTVVQHETVEEENQEDTKQDLEQLQETPFDVRFSTVKQEEAINEHREVSQNQGEVLKAFKLESESSVNGDDFFKCNQKDGHEKNSRASEDSTFNELKQIERQKSRLIE